MFEIVGIILSLAAFSSFAIVRLLGGGFIGGA
jgi:hypothetical protein